VFRVAIPYCTAWLQLHNSTVPVVDLFYLFFPKHIIPQYIHGILTGSSDDVCDLGPTNNPHTFTKQTLQYLDMSCCTYCHLCFTDAEDRIRGSVGG
jgi:hypothetical protein